MRVFGIRIGVSPLWFVFLFLLIFAMSDRFRSLYPGDDTKGFVLGLTAALLFPLSILLHELGHALVARRRGIHVAGIELWLLGGLARMRPAQAPGDEFAVAVAGPLVSLAITALCALAGATVFDWQQFWDAAMLRSYYPGMGGGEAVVGYVAIVNAFVFVFNLIPGLPLDGGRIALAIAWWRTGDRAKATKLAATLGRGVAYAIGAGGVILLVNNGDYVTGVWCLVVAVFIAQAAQAEEVWSRRVGNQLAGLRVADVMDPEPVVLPAQTKLDRALDEFFWRYRWSWFPVTDQHGHFVGLVTRENVEKVPEALRPGSTVDEVMAREPNAFRVAVDDPLESLVAAEGLHRLGALIAVDGDGVLRGVITVDQVRRALQPPAAVDTTA
jgi:Zn-dependent protease